MRHFFTAVLSVGCLFGAVGCTDQSPNRARGTAASNNDQHQPGPGGGHNVNSPASQGEIGGNRGTGTSDGSTTEGNLPASSDPATSGGAGATTAPAGSP